MIVITYNSGNQWKYKGEVLVYFKEDFVFISGGSVLFPGPNSEWELNPKDAHWAEMIKSIEGVNENV